MSRAATLAVLAIVAVAGLASAAAPADATRADADAVARVLASAAQESVQEDVQDGDPFGARGTQERSADDDYGDELSVVAVALIVVTAAAVLAAAMAFRAHSDD